MPITTPAGAMWNQRQVLAQKMPRFRELIEAVDFTSNLCAYQWMQMAALAIDYQPDVIIELGRARGNSTAMFLEVIQALGGPTNCRLVSICQSDTWFTHTMPKLKPLVSPDWFAGGDFLRDDIIKFDYGRVLDGAQRCLVFWDAHGFDVAEAVLGGLLPHLAGRSHRVMMHDMCDTRYEMHDRSYGEHGLWKNNNEQPPGVFLGHVYSKVAQSIAAVDFAGRIRMPLHSAAESFIKELTDLQRRELNDLLTNEFSPLPTQCHWFWFTMEEAQGPLTFPQLAAKNWPVMRWMRSALARCLAI